jgi:preprotein translocase subunit SecG
MRAVLMVVQVFASLAIIGLVLLQRGKGADAGAGFGSGASGTVFGARGATTTLSRATAIFAAVFMICSLALAYLGTRESASTRSVLDQVAAEQQKVTAPATNSMLPAPTAPIGSAPPVLTAPATSAPGVTLPAQANPGAALTVAPVKPAQPDAAKK